MGCFPWCVFEATNFKAMSERSRFETTTHALGTTFRLDPIRAIRGPLDHMGDPFDLGFREDGPDEIKFGAACLPVAKGDSEYGAVVLDDEERTVGLGHRLSQVPIGIENGSQLFYLAGEVLSVQPGPGVLDPSLTTTAEYFVDELGLGIPDIVEELVGQLGISPGIQALGRRGQVVKMSRTARPAPGLSKAHQAVFLEAGQLLADR